MGKQLKRENIIYGFAALLIFALLYAVSYPGNARAAEGRQEVKIVAFGDSVFGEIRDNTAVPVLLQDILGESVYNAALGGTCVARLEADRRMDYAKNSLSLAGLTKAVLAGDYRVQRSLRIRESNSEYFGEALEGLSQVDFSQVETILIQEGLNDYHAGVPVENPENPYDEYTFLGALRSSVRALRDTNPEIRIVLVTPTYTWYTEIGQTCEEQDVGGGILEEYVDAEIRAAEELGIEIIDVYHDFFPHEKWEDKDLYTRDGMHPNEEGRRLLAEKIAACLMTGR